jgi:hypothetical protein
MKRIGVVAVLIGLNSFAAAEEKSAASRVASVGLFKNGLAVVQRTLAVDGPGVYRVEDVPEPIHGTFWVESDAKISTRLTRRIVEVPARQAGGGNFQEELAGREVLIHFAQQGLPSVAGTVMEVEPARGEEAWNRAYQQPNYYYNWSSNPEQRAAPARMLVLTNETGRCYVDPARIAYLQVKGAGQTVTRRKPVMLFTVSDMKEKTATISISYLAKGMAWAPSYRVDVSDPNTLVLQQEAVVKNELEPIVDARVRLISGFPSVQFANVTSPLSLRQTWSNFFEQLNRRYAQGNPSLTNSISQQAVSFGAEGERDLSAIPAGEGVDLHYQDIGPQTLGEGDSLALETASGKAAYQRIVEWIVPDTRAANGAPLSDYERNADPEKYQDAVWDALRFRNPLDFPMTTAPATVVGNGRFQGQRLSYWVNSGEETTLQVTHALSIRTRCVEHEIGHRESLGDHYWRVTVRGELAASNHRKEAVTLVIRRRFSGELVAADQSPRQRLLEEGVYARNRRNELLWSLALQSGEEIKLAYTYTVVVWY